MGFRYPLGVRKRVKNHRNPSYKALFRVKYMGKKCSVNILVNNMGKFQCRSVNLLLIPPFHVVTGSISVSAQAFESVFNVPKNPL